MDYELLNLTKTNNTASIDDIDKLLNMIKLSSFDVLCDIQRNMTGYKRFDFKMSELKPTTSINGEISFFPKKYVTYIDSSFIGIGNRDAYRKSDFYNKELSIFDISSNPEVFNSLFMIFIDGKFFDTVNLFCADDKTYVIFDLYDGTLNKAGIEKEYFNQLIESDADVTAFFIPNAIYGALNTNRFVLEKYKNQLSLSRFNIVENLDNDTEFLSFINTNNILFGSHVTDIERSQDMLKFNIYPEDITNNSVFINIFGLKDVYDRISIPSGEDFFEIPLKNMPIPSDNFIIFKIIDGRKYFAHDIKIEHYYPNIYRVLNNTSQDELDIYILFKESTKESEEYKNDLDLYFKYTENIFQQYKDGTIPEFIKNYKPMNFKYDFDDYESTNYPPDHLSYKVNKIKQALLTKPDFMTDYIMLRNTDIVSYYVDISKIDLEDRLRYNNFNEITNPVDQETFIDPRYVFVFRKEFAGKSSNLILFVDGYRYLPDKRYTDNDYEYYYIPQEMLASNSIIEIEKVQHFTSTANITFNNVSDFKTINFKSNGTLITYNDVIVIRASDSKILKPDDYILTFDEIDNIPLGPDKTIYLPETFKLKITNVDYLNIDLKVYINKLSVQYRYDMKLESASVDKFTILNKSIPYDARNFRVFKNGRLLSPDLVIIKDQVYLSDPVELDLHIPRLPGEIYVMDYMPYKYKIIYSQDEINTLGFIDLTGKIDKPLDLNIVDIYLGGVRVNKNNIVRVSPTKIFIKDIPSLKNLVIIERNRDSELFSIRNSKDISDVIWETIPDLLYSFINKNTIHTVENLLEELVTMIADESYRFYIQNIILDRFVNPDINQINSETALLYPSLFTNNTGMINPDLVKTESVQELLFIDPDGEVVS